MTVDIYLVLDDFGERLGPSWRGRRGSAHPRSARGPRTTRRQRGSRSSSVGTATDGRSSCPYRSRVLL